MIHRYLSDRRYQEAAKRQLDPDHYNFPPLIEVKSDSGTVFRKKDRYGNGAWVQASIWVRDLDAAEISYRTDGVDDERIKN